MVGQSNHSVNWISLLSKYALNCLHMHGLIPFVCPRATLFKLQNGENCCAVIWSIGLCEIFNSLRCGRMPKSGTDDRRQFVKYNFCNGAMTGFSKRFNGNQKNDNYLLMEFIGTKNGMLHRIEFLNYLQIMVHIW